MKNRLLGVFSKAFNIANVDETISQRNCEKWDSLNHINLVVEIENEFDISIEPEEFDEMKDFRSIEKIVLSKLNN